MCLNLYGAKLKLDNLKYGFLISVTTLFGGSVTELYAQDDSGHKVTVENNEAYKKQFMQSVAPDLKNLKVDFVVDSVETKLSNGELLPDVNIIQLLAYLDQDSDEYQSYMASRHIVAHEMWHRICMMNEVLEKPMSASHYRTGRDNFEISASIVQLLTFRDDFINASPAQRQQLRKLDDPKIKMYVMAVENDIIRPLSKDKKDFDFEMEFIAKMVSGYWNNNLAFTYAPRHNAMTEKANRQEFQSPIYEKNFTNDIKVMNHIGGIDFSKFYNYKDVRFLKKFKQASQPDNKVLSNSLSAPNFETWVNKKSQLRRFSKQTIEIPNFTGNRLVEERERRPLNERVQPFRIADVSVGYKTYPLMKIPFYSAVTLRKNNTIYNLYPHGALEAVQQPDAQGISKVKTLFINGCVEEGFLKNGRKIGTFRFFDKNKKLIASAVFKNNRAIDGQVVLPAADGYILYTYKDGNLIALEEMSNKGFKKTICRIENGKPVSGLVPVVDTKDNHVTKSYQAYQDGKLIAALVFDDFNRLKEKQKINDKTIKIERFYDNGRLKYQANAEVKPILKKSASSPVASKLTPVPKTASPISSPSFPSKSDGVSIKSTSIPNSLSSPIANPLGKPKLNPLPSFSSKSPISLVEKNSIPVSHNAFAQNNAGISLNAKTLPEDKGEKNHIPNARNAFAQNDAEISLNAKILPEDKGVQITPTVAIGALPSEKSVAPQRGVLLSQPVIAREVLFNPDGNAVMLVQTQDNGHKNMRVKIKDFFALLTQTALPKTEKQSLMSCILKVKNKALQAIHPILAPKSLHADVIARDHTNLSSLHSPKQQYATDKHSVQITVKSFSDKTKSSQKISLFKNKFRFFMAKQKGWDKN